MFLRNNVVTGHAQPDPQQWWENPLVWIIVACVIAVAVAIVVVVCLVKRYQSEIFTVSLNNDGDIECMTVKQGAKLQLPLLKREGYRFAGWFTDTAFTVPFLQTMKIHDNLMLYAKWVKEAE